MSHKLSLLSLSLPFLMWFAATESRAAQAKTDAPIEVMILGTFHMANPGADAFNVEVDDVLTPKRQAEIQATVDALARFKPDKIALEYALPESATLEIPQYAEYLDGKLDGNRNERVQLGYRLAAKLKHEAVYGIDVEGDLDFDSVFAFAGNHGMQPLVDQLMQTGQQMVADMQQKLAVNSVGAQLYWLNDPQAALRDHGFYTTMLKIGDRHEQPAAKLLAAWSTRNLMICGRLVQISAPGERIIVMYGSGHNFLLRQCVQQLPGFKLIEARDWLPRE